MTKETLSGRLVATYCRYCRYCSFAIVLLTLRVAVEQASRRCVAVQRLVDGQYPRILRERRQDAPGQEGTRREPPATRCKLTARQGISLSIEQYKALLAAVPAINKTLRETGHFAAADDTDETAVATTVKSKKENSKPSKANIEATSDEDEG